MLAEIGSGGFGRVFAAVNENLEQRVAIKMLLEPGPNEHLWREARAAARLRSAHCVQVFDVDRLSCGSPYVVMELLAGMSLKAHLRREGPVPPTQAIRWTRQLCSALREAHGAQLIHSDIKPSNVFVELVDGRSRVKLVDFGLARKPSTQAQEARPRRNVVYGSPAYMSPEQVRGDALSFASDIWSLGVLLYEMLSGQRPFRGERATVLFAAIAADPPLPLSEVAPEVPAALIDVVHRCLRKTPGERFGSVAELDRALQRLEGEVRESAADTGSSVGETTASCTLVGPRKRDTRRPPQPARSTTEQAGLHPPGRRKTQESPSIPPLAASTRPPRTRANPAAISWRAGAFGFVTALVAALSWHVRTEPSIAAASTTSSPSVGDVAASRTSRPQPDAARWETASIPALQLARSEPSGSTRATTAAAEHEASTASRRVTEPQRARVARSVTAATTDPAAPRTARVPTTDSRMAPPHLASADTTPLETVTPTLFVEPDF